MEMEAGDMLFYIRISPKGSCAVREVTLQMQLACRNELAQSDALLGMQSTCDRGHLAQLTQNCSGS